VGQTYVFWISTSVLYLGTARLLKLTNCPCSFLVLIHAFQYQFAPISHRFLSRLLQLSYLIKLPQPLWATILYHLSKLLYLPHAHSNLCPPRFFPLNPPNCIVPKATISAPCPPPISAHLLSFLLSLPTASCQKPLSLPPAHLHFPPLDLPNCSCQPRQSSHT